MRAIHAAAAALALLASGCEIAAVVWLRSRAAPPPAGRHHPLPELDARVWLPDDGRIVATPRGPRLERPGCAAELARTPEPVERIVERARADAGAGWRGVLADTGDQPNGVRSVEWSQVGEGGAWVRVHYQVAASGDDVTCAGDARRPEAVRCVRSLCRGVRAGR